MQSVFPAPASPMTALFLKFPTKLHNLIRGSRYTIYHITCTHIPADFFVGDGDQLDSCPTHCWSSWDPESEGCAGFLPPIVLAVFYSQ